MVNSFRKLMDSLKAGKEVLKDFNEEDIQKKESLNKKYEDTNSVRTQLLSLLENDENKVIVETKIDNIVSIYKQRL